VLREHYDVYLWKCCEMGSAWMRDPEAVASYSAKYEGVQQLLSATTRTAGPASVAVMALGWYEQSAGFCPDADPTTPGLLLDCENLLPSELGMRPDRP
jgi:hypothetical protein